MRTRPALLASLLASLAALALGPVTAVARPRAGGPSNACPASVLPLAVGNQWTYATVAAPLPAAPEIARIAPPTPKGFVITVKSIEASDGDTVVTLEEKLTYDLTRDPKKPLTDERVVTSTITCNAKKFDISPDSFFFAGEPGGYGGLVIDSYERKGTSWQLTRSGGFGDTEWPEDLLMTWSRKPSEGVDVKLGGGKLELERRFTPLVGEAVVTKAGSYGKAEKLAVKTTGRVTLANPISAGLKPMELPADWINIFWFVGGTGVVQTLNRYAHMYQLVDSQLK